MGEVRQQGRKVAGTQYLFVKSLVWFRGDACITYGEGGGEKQPAGCLWPGVWRHASIGRFWCSTSTGHY